MKHIYHLEKLILSMLLRRPDYLRRVFRLKPENISGRFRGVFEIIEQEEDPCRLIVNTLKLYPDAYDEICAAAAADSEVTLTELHYQRLCRQLIEEKINLELPKIFTDLARDHKGFEYWKTCRNYLDEYKDSLLEKQQFEQSGKNFRDYYLEDVLPKLEGEQGEGIRSIVFPGFNVPGGHAPGNLVSIVGQYGAGKSFFALALALDYARQQLPCCFISYEQNKIELACRINQLATGIDALDFRDARRMRTDKQFAARIIAAVQSLPRFPVYTEHTTGSDMELFELMRSYIRDNNTKIFMVDYLNLIDINRTNRSDQRYLEVEHLSRRLKKFALKENVLLVVLSQFNRAGNTSGDVNDIAESMALLKDSDYVYSLIQPCRDPADEGKKFSYFSGVYYAYCLNDVVVKLEKNRNSQYRGKFVCNFVQNRFVELSVQ